jgi:hypothetical protein
VPLGRGSKTFLQVKTMNLSKLLAGILTLGLSACALGAAERVPSLHDPSNPEAPESSVQEMAAVLADNASAFPALSGPSGGAEHSHGGAHAGHGASAPDAGAPSATIYSCPMHPEVTSPEPGRCPKCGMNLVPSKPTGSGAETQGHEGHTSPSEGDRR